MSNPGRKLDPVWGEFKKLPTSSGKGMKAKCKSCGLEMQGLVARMKLHIQKCNGTKEKNEDPATSNNEDQNSETDPVVSPSASKQKRSSVMNQLSTEGPSLKIKQPQLSSFVVRTSEKQKEDLDKQVAKFCYATNSSFRCINHPEFKKLVSMLRPGYTPPSSSAVAGVLLQEIYQSERVKCFNDLFENTVCMSLDGWSNVHNEPIVCVTVTSENGDVHLFNTIDTSGHPHTHDYLIELAINSVKSCESELKCNVRSFVTDNASNMAKMRSALKESEDIDVITYGCSAHILNLLSQDLTKDTSNIKEHVVEIVKYFRNNHFANAKFRSEGGQSLILPQEVRWNTLSDCLESYIKNWPLLMKICEENRDNIQDSIKRKVSDLQIKRNAEDLLNILKPIALALDLTQRNDCTIGQAVKVWKKLKFDLEELQVLKISTNDTKTKMFEKRYNQALAAPHFLAFIVDPVLNNSEYVLQPSEHECAFQFAQEKYAGTSFLSTLVKYQAKSQPFIQTMFTEEVVQGVSAVQWWKSQENVIGKMVIDNVMQLLTARASSAGVERVFSTFGVVHSKLRNRLGVDKASKLVFLYKHLNKEAINVTEEELV